MPQTTEDIIRTIKSDNESVVSKMLFDLIDAHRLDEGGAAEAAYKRYKQSAVPIQAKTFQSYEKVHERIPNDFFGDIVDLKTGYMGNEIIITIDEKKVEGEAELEKEQMFLTTFAQRESLTDENSELVKMAAITGKTYRLLFVSAEDGEVSVMNSPAWETVLYRDGSIKTPAVGMRYYQVEEIEYGLGSDGTPKLRYRIEWYDKTEVTYYRENADAMFVLDLTKPADGIGAHTGKQLHFFDGVPIIDFMNNEEAMGEAKKVFDLIDAYDNILSDSTSEVEQLRMAYLWARGAGMKLDKAFEDALRQTGVWPLPQDGEIGFASKNLGGAAPFVEAVLGEIRRNIYSFAKSMDLSNDKGGNMRVIGWQIALLRLEMSAQVTERKFKKSYMRQYTLLTSFWREKKAMDIDPLSLRFVFTRKFPKDIDQEIDTLVKSMEVLPLETAYGLMTFIDDPVELAAKFKEERPEMAGILAALDDGDGDGET